MSLHHTAVQLLGDVYILAVDNMLISHGSQTNHFLRIKNENIKESEVSDSANQPVSRLIMTLARQPLGHAVRFVVQRQNASALMLALLYLQRQQLRPRTCGGGSTQDNGGFTQVTRSLRPHVHDKAVSIS